MKIIWSDEATKDYHQNIDYLLKEWPEKVVIEFIDDVETVIDLIELHPQLYPITEHKEVRKAVIHKNITLFFKTTDNEIHLIRFWNNYQDPKKLKL